MPAVKAYYNILAYFASISRTACTYHLVTAYCISNYLPIGYIDTSWRPDDQVGRGQGSGGSPRRGSLSCPLFWLSAKFSAPSAIFCLT